MCIFSREVYKVENTSIFTKKIDSRQVVIYEMEVGTNSEMSMILPIPNKNKDDNSVKFYDFSEYDNFFQDIEQVFNPPSDGISTGYRSLKLTTHKIGSFDAVYIPTLNDFNRVDTRFKLDSSIWDQLPQYENYSFVVFKLRNGHYKAHPMAFSFETSLDELYFPTVHIHDGQVHKKEHFDHNLYFQAESSTDIINGNHGEQFVRNRYPEFTKNIQHDKCYGLINHDTIFKAEVHGDHVNEDILVQI